MRLHPVRSYPAAARPAVQDQLAWQRKMLQQHPCGKALANG